MLFAGLIPHLPAVDYFGVGDIFGRVLLLFAFKFVFRGVFELVPIFEFDTGVELDTGVRVAIGVGVDMVEFDIEFVFRMFALLVFAVSPQPISSATTAVMAINNIIFIYRSPRF